MSDDPYTVDDSQMHPLLIALNEAQLKEQHAQRRYDEAVTENNEIKARYREEGRPLRTEHRYGGFSIPTDVRRARSNQSDAKRELGEAQERVKGIAYSYELRHLPFWDAYKAFMDRFNGSRFFYHPSKAAKDMRNTLYINAREAAKRAERGVDRVNALAHYYTDLGIEFDPETLASLKAQLDSLAAHAEQAAATAFSLPTVEAD